MEAHQASDMVACLGMYIWAVWMSDPRQTQPWFATIQFAIVALQTYQIRYRGIIGLVANTFFNISSTVHVLAICDAWAFGDIEFLPRDSYRYQLATTAASLILVALFLFTKQRFQNISQSEKPEVRTPNRPFKTPHIVLISFDPSAGAIARIFVDLPGLLVVRLDDSATQTQLRPKNRAEGHIRLAR